MRSSGRAGLVVTAVLVGLVVVGCTTSSPPTDARSSAAAPAERPSVGRAAGSSATPTPAPPSSTVRPPTSVTLAFAGDVHFEGHVRSLLDDPASLAVLQPVIGAADLSMLNLETSITSRGVEQPKLYHFRVAPQALDLLKAAGLDVLTMANNHTVDYGPLGLTDSLAAVATSPIPVVGFGPNAAAAFAPAVFTVSGVSIAVIGSSQLNDYTIHAYPATSTTPGIAGNLDPTRLLAAVRAARAKYDIVVVYEHWGTDYTECPDGAQRATASMLAKEGVDIVVGSHAHRIQGSGWLGRTYVAYGLGNFIWMNTRGDIDKHSGVLTLSVDPAAAIALRGASLPTRLKAPSVVRTAAWQPLMVGDADGIPRRPSAAKEKALYDAWVTNRGCARLASRPLA